MYVVKIDLPTGVVYFTGKKKRVQDFESPGLTENIELAKVYEDEEEAKKFCKMLIKRYDMEFYYSSLDEPEEEAEIEEEALVEEPELSESLDLPADLDEDDVDKLVDASDFTLELPEELNADVPEEDPFGEDFKVNIGGMMDDDKIF